MNNIFVYEAENMKDVYGYVKDNNVGNLPNNINGKNINWKFWRTLHIEENEPPRLGLNTKEMLDAINNNGFYLNSISIDIQISE